MIAIVDYDTGNLRSVANALQRLGAEFCITSDHEAIRRADHVLLPGVGEASSAMDKLRQRGLDTLIPSLSQPVLGICIGLQLMCAHSEEGDAHCLGIFPCDVRRLVPEPGSCLKVPHMGWDTVGELSGRLFEGINDGAYFYYVHSFAADICHESIATTDYCRPFSTALHSDNFYGVQFHPEKSGSVGAQLLDNFLKL